MISTHHIISMMTIASCGAGNASGYYLPCGYYQVFIFTSFGIASETLVLCVVCLYRGEIKNLLNTYDVSGQYTYKGECDMTQPFKRLSRYLHKKSQSFVSSPKDSVRD